MLLWVLLFFLICDFFFLGGGGDRNESFDRSLTLWVSDFKIQVVGFLCGVVKWIDWFVGLECESVFELLVFHFPFICVAVDVDFETQMCAQAWGLNTVMIFKNLGRA
jgi:hypothetical protein